MIHVLPLQGNALHYKIRATGIGPLGAGNIHIYSPSLVFQNNKHAAVLYSHKRRDRCVLTGMGPANHNITSCVHIHMPRLIHFILATIVYCCCATTVTAQLTDNTSTLRNINQPSFLRLHYDNDFFTGTDQYYSQGITIEYRHPQVQHWFPARLLLAPASSPAQYGITLNFFGYTPTSIASDSILYGDRPFDGNISLKLFAVRPDPVHQQQISSAISLGVMGPLGLGREIQAGIHQLTKNPQPHGWQYQVRNDLIINYQLNYEKKLSGNNRHLLLNAAGEARLGTLNTQLDAGLNLQVGKFNPRYALPFASEKQTEIYLSGQFRTRFVGYNATLQGGLFNRTSPYTIAARDINRIVYQADAGLIINLRKMFFSYTQSYISKEFRGGHHFRWGGVSMGFVL